MAIVDPFDSMKGGVSDADEWRAPSQLESLSSKVDWIQESTGEWSRTIERRMASAEEEVIKALERINVLRNELDAATSRIAQLEGRDGFDDRLNAFVSTLDEMGDRVRRLESQTQFEATEDDARIRSLENEMARSLDKVWSKANPVGQVGPINTDESFTSWAGRHIGRLDSAVWSESGEDRITKAHQRITSETGRTNGLRNEYITDRRRIFERLTALENGSRLVGTGDLIPDTMDRLPKTVLDMVLDEAEVRIRNYMTGYFSGATVSAVIAALRGEMTASPSLVTDHAFRFYGRDRYRCSWQSDPGVERCGRTIAEHIMGATGSPIRDNPQA